MNLGFYKFFTAEAKIFKEYILDFLKNSVKSQKFSDKLNKYFEDLRKYNGKSDFQLNFIDFCMQMPVLASFYK